MRLGEMMQMLWGGRLGLSAIRIACVATGLLATMAPAQAHPDSVAIDVTAEIKERCGFTAKGPASVDAPRDLEDAASLSIKVGLDCNTPYAVGVTSENGALVNLDARDDGSGYAFSKSYRVALALETDRGIVRSERCRSGELSRDGNCDFAASRAGKGLKSGRGISVGRDAIITIDWPAQSTLPRRLAAGRYKDTLILVVGPRG